MKRQSMISAHVHQNRLKTALISGAALLALGASSVSAMAEPAPSTLIASQAAAQVPRLLPRSAAVENQLSFADLVEEVSPAVVSIHTEQTVSQRPVPREFERFFNSPFGQDVPDELRERFPERFQEQERRAEAEGSGFFIDNNGHIVTNNHVIDGAEKITVRLTDGTELPADLVGVDPGTDLAVLKVAARSNQKFVEFSEDLNLRVGDWVLAVGNPFGLGGTVTSGIVSAIGRANYTSNYSDFIQIDASINRGNSGGPTFDLSGRVVGVNTAIYSPTGGSVGIGFAIPSDTANYIVSQLIEKGSVTRGWLGVEIRPFDNNHAAAVGLDSSEGALVVNVQNGTPAANAGMESGDIVLKFNNETVEDARDLTRRVGNVEPGKSVNLLVYRGDKNVNLKVTLGDRKDLDLASDAGAPESKSDIEPADELADELGVSFKPLNDEEREALNLDQETEGLLITGVLPNSPGADANIVRGMVILEAENKAVRSTNDLSKIINAAEEGGKEAILLRVQVGGRKDFRALPIESSKEEKSAWDSARDKFFKGQ